jgi:hypothetical protein
MKRIALFLVVLASCADGYTDGVNTQTSEASIDLTVASGEALKSADLVPQVSIAASELGVSPNDMSVCISGPDGRPKSCCNVTATETCCFFFSTGSTECTFKGGPPIQTP